MRLNAFAIIFNFFILVECKSDFDCKAEKPYCAKFGMCVGKPDLVPLRLLLAVEGFALLIGSTGARCVR